MSGRILDWLVVKWQWPYAALFTAGFLGVLAPLVFRYAGTPLGLVYLQLPIYMLHQYEEHAGDRFRLWVNAMLGHGRDVLTPSATFWINSLLVWLLDLVALYLACFVDLSLGLIAFYLPMLNAFGHIVPAIIKRQSAFEIKSFKALSKWEMSGTGSKTRTNGAVGRARN